MHPGILSRRQALRRIAAGVAAGSAFALRPVRAEPTIEWKMATTWPKNFPGLGTGANYLAKLIEETSGGRMRVRVFGADELLPAMGVFDAVSRGTVQMGHATPYYWKGKHEASQYFSAVPFGLNAQEMNGWLYHGGGYALWKEVYAPFGILPFCVGNSGVQMGGWFNKEIRSIGDFKGLKMRIPGLGGDVLRKFGATVVTIPGGEIFQSLKSGAIDASEWVGPFNDLAFGLHKAAKFYYWPGWHEPGTTIECLVNQKAFEALPKDLQACVRAACQAANLDMMAELAAKNAQALDALTGQHKVELRKLPDEVLLALGKASREVLADLAAKDPLTKKVHASFDAFLKGALRWQKISEEGYSLARAAAYS